jgi:hypothetical protein
MWDHEGKFIIQTADVTTVPVVGCRNKCFTTQNFDDRKSIVENKELGF